MASGLLCYPSAATLDEHAMLELAVDMVLDEAVLVEEGMIDDDGVEYTYLFEDVNEEDEETQGSGATSSSDSEDNDEEWQRLVQEALTSRRLSIDLSALEAIVGGFESRRGSLSLTAAEADALFTRPSSPLDAVTACSVASSAPSSSATSVSVTVLPLPDMLIKPEMELWALPQTVVKAELADAQSEAADAISSAVLPTFDTPALTHSTSASSDMSNRCASAEPSAPPTPATPSTVAGVKREYMSIVETRCGKRQALAGGATGAGYAIVIAASSSGMPVIPNDGQKRVGAYTMEERRLRIERFLEKRARRVWRKRIKYDCRKKLADNRPRIKGRFVKRECEEELESMGDEIRHTAQMDQDKLLDELAGLDELLC